MKPEEWLKEAERLLSSAAGVRHPSGTPAGADSGEAVRARLAESASRAERWAERFRLANGIPNPGAVSYGRRETAFARILLALLGAGVAALLSLSAV